MTILESPKTRYEFQSLLQKNKHKKVFAYFYADWCNPCKSIKQTIYDEFNKVSGEKLLILVNVDTHDDVASFFRIRGIPAIMSFKEGERHNFMDGTSLKDISSVFSRF